ncbi:MAG: ribonuclease D [Rhodospirillaceae bacterium]
MSRSVTPKTPTIHLHQGDLPGGLDFGEAVAIDTETQGLNLNRDRLCVVQLSAGDGVCHLVQIAPSQAGAPNLKALCEDTAVTKIFHYARFDIAALKKWLGIQCRPVYCTKIASKLVRTYTDGHGLKDVVRELAGVDLDKQQQSTDWARADLSPAQQGYAANDVLYLHRVRDALDGMIRREGREDLLQACFQFLEHRVALDLGGWCETDIFSH